jgi:transmembrane sensor
VASDSDRISTEAAIWLARLERGLQADEGSSLRIWLRQSAHRDAIVEAAKLWHGPDILAVLAELVPVGFGQAPPPKVKRTYPGAVIFAICVGICVAVTPFITIYRTMPGVINHNYKAPQRPVPWGETVYATKPGEIRAINLPDGSKVTLNSHTQLRVLLGGGFRVANLDYGEVIFRIAPEPRPFEVNAGGRHFQAPPSMFDVHMLTGQAVELTVLDGGVTVRGLPWHWPSTPAEARLFDPDAFVDTTVGPLQAARLEDQMIGRYPITAANARARLRWEPEDVIYVTP